MCGATYALEGGWYQKEKEDIRMTNMRCAKLLLKWVKRIPYALMLLMFALAVPMVLRLVPPNRFYGVRTRATFDDHDLWYAVNEQTGIMMMIGALAGFIFVYGYERLSKARVRRRILVQNIGSALIVLLVPMIQF